MLSFFLYVTLIGLHLLTLFGAILLAGSVVVRSICNNTYTLLFSGLLIVLVGTTLAQGVLHKMLEVGLPPAWSSIIGTAVLFVVSGQWLLRWAGTKAYFLNKIEDSSNDD